MNRDIDAVPAAPFGRYVRRLPGADLSLEANTDLAPVPGLFYVLRGRQVDLASEDFALVQARYKDLCREYWDRHLDSPDRLTSMASAWGLLGIDVRHIAAGSVIEAHGSAADHKRLAQMRGRAFAMKRARMAKKRTATAAAATAATAAAAAIVAES